ncbi:MAG: hypothetical protein PGN11_21105 [Quadrisphaera sp.]
MGLMGWVMTAVTPSATPTPSPSGDTDYGSTREFLQRMLSEASPTPGPFSGFAGPAGRLLGVVLFLVLVAAVLGLAVSLVAAVGSLRKGGRATGHLLSAVGCALVILIIGTFSTFTLGWFDLLS